MFDASVSIVLKGIQKRPDGRDAIKSLAGVSFLWKKFVDVTDTDRGTERSSSLGSFCVSDEQVVNVV